jgi:hypothetical protein
MASNRPSGESNLGDSAGRRQSDFARGSIYNPELPEDSQNLTFFFKPEPIREQLQANYDKMSVIGMSHQYQSYSFTNNMAIQFDLYMNSLMMTKEGFKGGTNRSINRNTTGENNEVETSQQTVTGASAEIEWSRRYLEALLVPPVNFTGLIGSSPPAVILSLPGIVTIRCRLMQLSVEFVSMDIHNNIKELKMKVKFEEAPLNRITMQDVLENGSFRTWGGGGSY